MIALASDVNVEFSLRIAAQRDLAPGLRSDEVSVVAASPCAVDGWSPIVALEAVGTPLSSGPTAANRHSKRRARPGRKSQETAKNLLRWEVQQCVILSPKTGSSELGFRRTCVRRSVHDRFGVRRECRVFSADRCPT